MIRSMKCSPLTEDNIHRINCAPGGLELEGQDLTGDLTGVIDWHVDMMRCGMTGFAFSRDDAVRGFVQYMPGESAPLPIIAPRSAVLLCFHYNAAAGEGEDEHLAAERMMVHKAVDDARRRFDGMAAVGWDHAIHFPIPLLEDLGFCELHREGELALLWLPFAGDALEPSVAPRTLDPLDLGDEGRVAVDLAWSHRCPYDVHHRTRIRRLLDDMDPDRISYREVLMDTRTQVLSNRAPSWNWQWLYVNGRELAPHQLTEELLRGILEEL